MRTTINLADDVAAAAEKLSRERHIGMSEAVNELARAGLQRARAPRRFTQKTVSLGVGIDVSNVAEALETLEALDRDEAAG